MTRTRTILVLLLATSVGVAAADDLVWRVVTTDCATGEDKRELVLLGRLPGVESLLAEILTGGPDAERLETLAQQLGQRWDRRQEFLADDLQTGLAPGLVEALALESRDAYVERELARFSANVRDRAATTLVSIGTDTALDLLDQARAKGDDGLRTTIDRAIEQFAGGGDLGEWQRAPRARERGMRRSQLGK